MNSYVRMLWLFGALAGLAMGQQKGDRPPASAQVDLLLPPAFDPLRVCVGFSNGWICRLAQAVYSLDRKTWSMP